MGRRTLVVYITIHLCPSRYSHLTLLTLLMPSPQSYPVSIKTNLNWPFRYFYYYNLEII